MATTLISPGVLAIENDQSFISQQPITVGAAIIGPTVKGQPEIPTIVTSYSDYQNKFGTTFISASQVYTYFTSIAAYNYFNNGGESLLVARVVSGTFTSATTNSSSVANCFIASTGSSATQSFSLQTLSKGIIMNSSSSLDVSGSLASGSSDNIRWQIVNTLTNQGTFDLLIRRGDDNTNNPIVLETWTGLSLDPFAPNYVSRVLGDYTLNYNSTTNQVEISGSYPNRSAYVRVASVDLPTPNYFDNNGNPQAVFTGSLPATGSGSFGAAVGGIMAGAQFYDAITDGNKSQGIPSASYNNILNL